MFRKIMGISKVLAMVFVASAVMLVMHYALCRDYGISASQRNELTVLHARTEFILAAIRREQAKGRTELHNTHSYVLELKSIIRNMNRMHDSGVPVGVSPLPETKFMLFVLFPEMGHEFYRIPELITKCEQIISIIDSVLGTEAYAPALHRSSHQKDE